GTGPLPRPRALLRRRRHDLGYGRPHRRPAGAGPGRRSAGERATRREAGTPDRDGRRDARSRRLRPARPAPPRRAGLAPARAAEGDQEKRRRSGAHPQPRSGRRSAPRDGGRRAGDDRQAGRALPHVHHLHGRRAAGRALPDPLRRARALQGRDRRADHPPDEAAPGAAALCGEGDGRRPVGLPDDRRHHDRHPHRGGGRRADGGRAVRLRHRRRAGTSRRGPDPAHDVRPAGRAAAGRRRAARHHGQPGAEVV
ncbi:MAG: hypothetical protein AVDCRST_MAG51-2807, partial [uncultured Ramlibacter sp.]